MLRVFRYFDLLRRVARDQFLETRVIPETIPLWIRPESPDGRIAWPGRLRRPSMKSCNETGGNRFSPVINRRLLRSIRKVTGCVAIDLSERGPDLMPPPIMYATSRLSQVDGAAKFQERQ